LDWREGIERERESERESQSALAKKYACRCEEGSAYLVAWTQQPCAESEGEGGGSIQWEWGGGRRGVEAWQEGRSRSRTREEGGEGSSATSWHRMMLAM
jgi:hypothetical protein